MCSLNNHIGSSQCIAADIWASSLASCIEGFGLYPACFLLPAVLQMSLAPVVDGSCLLLSVGHQLVLTQTVLWRRRATSTPCQKLKATRTSSALRYGCCWGHGHSWAGTNTDFRVTLWGFLVSTFVERVQYRIKGFLMSKGALTLLCKDGVNCTKLNVF